MYIQTSLWVLHTPNAGGNSHFQLFYDKKLEKQEICNQNFAKNTFLSLHQNPGRLFYSPKIGFQRKNLIFLWNKTVDQRFDGNLKKCVFCQNLLQISCFFAEKMLKITISTSVWSAQHQKAGQNIQYLLSAIL